MLRVFAICLPFRARARLVLPLFYPRRYQAWTAKRFNRLPGGGPCKTIHPNCAHRVLPYIWTQKTKEEQEDALRQAKKPFNLDPRGEAERLRYEKAQRENAERLRDRKQWERYRAVLGDQAPKTFSGFRAMKRAGSEKWLDMTSDYQYALKIMRKDVTIMSHLSSSLPIKGEPDSIKDLAREDGSIKQRRFYGKDGRPDKDLDLSNHGNKKRHPIVPHAHDWRGGVRGTKDRPWSEEEKRQNADLLGGDEDV